MAAGYQIVLNLTGNAVTKAGRLAKELERANLAAKSLAATLPMVGRSLNAASLQNARGLSPAQIRAAGDAQAKAILAREKALAVARTSQINAMRAERRERILSNRTTRRSVTPPHRRHDSTRILSYGTGFNIGGFNGRFSNIFQPDANGQLFGMDANKLMKGANIAAIATSLMASVGKLVLKTIAYSTAAPLAIGGIGMMSAIRMLESEGFAEGVRLISRRHQAKQGLGKDFERAQMNADYLAGSYGLDRSTTISSINVMTGMGVGGSKRKLSLAESTDLTKVGGIISQHHGVPFERVMTNIQQLLVQDKPNLRDIRELLNQAPILQNYALREMTAKNVQGMDVRTYLKDQRNILSVLKSYEMDNATNAGMRARGQISLAKQDFWAKIASNDNAWQYVGMAGSSIIGSAATALDKFLTSLSNNDSFKIMVKQIEYVFDNLGEKGGAFMDKLLRLVELAAEKLGVDLGDRTKAKLVNDQEAALKYAMYSPEYRANVEKQMDAAGLLKNMQTPEARKQAVTQFIDETYPKIAKDERTAKFITGNGMLADATSDYATRNGKIVSNTPWNREVGNTQIIDQYHNTPYNPEETFRYNPVEKRVGGYGNVTGSEAWKNPLPWGYNFFNVRDIGRWTGADKRNITDPEHAFVNYDVSLKELTGVTKELIEERAGIGALDPSLFKKTGDSGDDLSGMNKDRRSLIINFNNKLVEWNSTINAINPKETVNEVAENLEQLTSEAIQKALLGASNTMASSWY